MPRVAQTLFLMFLWAIFTITLASPLTTNGTATTHLAKRDYTSTVRFGLLAVFRLNSPYYTQATYYDVGLGACGEKDQNSDHVVAVCHTSRRIYPYNPDNQLGGLKSL